MKSKESHSAEPEIIARKSPSAAPMKHSAVALLVAAIALGAAASTHGQTDFLEPVDQALFLESENGSFRTDLSGSIDAEYYYIDQNPPGLIFPNDDHFFNPRVSLFLDTQLGDHVYSLVQARFDRGFDPGSKPDGDSRLDEYFVRYTPFDDSRLNLQVGKFATVFGGWVPRHLSWDNPFVNAPLAYEHVTTITDQAVPGGPGGFLGRKNRPDVKGGWLPIVWGPAYTSGASAFGNIKRFEYAFEFKNASVSSRPTAWDPFRINWDHPTVSGRIGYSPNASWRVGSSFSYGAYLLPPAAATLPASTGLGDSKQLTVGTDVSWSWRHWQVWAEAIAARFEVPNVGDAETLSYFLEAKYKFTPKLFGAARWNQQLFDEVPNGAGGSTGWDQDVWRIETALGYRFTRHIQTKLQYSFSEMNGPIDQGQQLVAGQLTLRF